MWIFCCGSIRSGSTLQYLIVKEIVEQLNIGCSVGYTESFDDLYMKFDNKDFKVVKTHQITPFMENLLKRGEAKGIYCFRDIRDVSASLISKFNHNQYTFNHTSFVNKYLRYHNQVKGLQNIYISKYEDFYDSISTESMNIASFLGINSFNKLVAQGIEEKLRYSNQRRKLEETKLFEYVDKNGLNYEIDFNTLLHKNHINYVIPGGWQNHLSRCNSLLLEEQGYFWLLKNGYLIKWDGHVNKVLSILKNKTKSFLKKVR